MTFVPGFLPSIFGLHFVNGSGPQLPVLSIPTPFGNVNIGDTALGICGGMVFTARDFFEAKALPPVSTSAPSSQSDPVFTYLINRFFDSFNLPGGVVRYYALMDPALPDHETELSKIGLAPHGRGWTMIHDEWPKIKADIDNGHPSPMALVLIKSVNPGDLGANHVVLAYGYDLNGTDLTLHIYDPNFPDNPNQTIRLSIADPFGTVALTSNHPGLNCFFRLDYTAVFPWERAVCISQTAPPQPFTPGHSYAVSVTMQNTGITTWTRDGGNPVRLGSQNPQDNTIWGTGRVDVPGLVPPGASTTFIFTVVAPTSPGIYRFQWRMVQEGVTWFGDLTPEIDYTISKGHKDIKDKEGKAEKDGKDHKDRDSNFTKVNQEEPVLQGAGGSSGHKRTFITPEERPAVGQRALERKKQDQSS